jgi:hypothetical protein
MSGFFSPVGEMPRSGRGVNHAESKLIQRRCRVAAEGVLFPKRTFLKENSVLFNIFHPTGYLHIKKYYKNICIF